MDTKEKETNLFQNKMTPEDLFQDAQSLYQEALHELSRGNIRNAAEKAWGATVQASNALILTKTGIKPERVSITTGQLHKLRSKDPRLAEKAITERYHERADFLHGRCFYDGICDQEETKRIVEETKDYIEDVRKLADKGYIS